MPKTEISDTWEIMAFIQKHRGAALVGDILNVSETQVRRFSRNHKMNYADPSAPNPFDWVIGLMDEIHDLGKEFFIGNEMSDEIENIFEMFSIFFLKGKHENNVNFIASPLDRGRINGYCNY